MFKNFIREVINIVTIIQERLLQAYEETYGCEELTFQFESEVRLRKRHNKSEFIQKAVKQVVKDVLKKEGYLISQSDAIIIAERLFEEAKKNNDIDILNNLIIKE